MTRRRVRVDGERLEEGGERDFGTWNAGEFKATCCAPGLVWMVHLTSILVRTVEALEDARLAATGDSGQACCVCQALGPRPKWATLLANSPCVAAKNQRIIVVLYLCAQRLCVLVPS